MLIVDDEPNILLSLQFLMKKTGYEVRTAKDGEEALAEISRAAPDLVLLDVMMPKIDGFSICEQIRANPEWKDMRIIMLTARGRDIEREKGLALGADDYITKPFSTKDAIAGSRPCWLAPEKRTDMRSPKKARCDAIATSGPVPGVRGRTTAGSAATQPRVADASPAVRASF